MLKRRWRICSEFGVSGALPFVIRGQALTSEGAIGRGFLEGDMDHGFIVSCRVPKGMRPDPAGLLRPAKSIDFTAPGLFRGGCQTCRCHKLSESADGHFRPVDRKRIDGNHVRLE